MTEIELKEPVIGRSSIKFSWSMRPESPLYRANAFSLHFPEEVDVSRISRSLCWTALMICLHAHWLLLRPCRVRLPVRLRPGHRAVWERLLQASQDTIDANCNGQPLEGRVELEESGEPLPSPRPLADTGLCATSFSGGKDSLTQTGILCELTNRPLLVATTSPMDGREDHSTARRRTVFAKIQARKNVRLVEVRSDLRAILDNGFPGASGYRLATNEVADTFLYTASLIAAGAACGATHLFMASEAEVQENSERDGKIIQHKHFMYSAPTQRALDALIRGEGLRYGSLTASLHNYPQVQTLLWTRYQEISDLQYSCWRLHRNEAACSGCELCFNAALCALFNGGNPARMGIDMVKLFKSKKDWKPREESPAVGGLPPERSLMRKIDAHMVHYIQHIPLRRVLELIAGRRPPRPLAGELREAMRAYAGLRKMARARPVHPLPGYRPLFLKQIDPFLREQVASIYASRFSAEPEADYLPLLQRGDRLADWICWPLEKDASN